MRRIEYRESVGGWSYEEDRLLMDMYDDFPKVNSNMIARAINKLNGAVRVGDPGFRSSNAVISRHAKILQESEVALDGAIRNRKARDEQNRARVQPPYTPSPKPLPDRHATPDFFVTPSPMRHYGVGALLMPEPSRTRRAIPAAEPKAGQGVDLPPLRRVKVKYRMSWTGTQTLTKGSAVRL